MMNYKGKPLVRKGDTIYYGDMADDYVAMIHINKTEKSCDMDMASDVSIQLISTDETKSLKDRIVKKAERPGLYEALNIADIWMNRL